MYLDILSRRGLRLFFDNYHSILQRKQSVSESNSVHLSDDIWPSHHRLDYIRQNLYPAEPMKTLQHKGTNNLPELYTKKS
jgi:hypothetical protein